MCRSRDFPCLYWFTSLQEGRWPVTWTELLLHYTRLPDFTISPTAKFVCCTTLHLSMCLRALYPRRIDQSNTLHLNFFFLVSDRQYFGGGKCWWCCHELSRLYICIMKQPLLLDVYGVRRRSHLIFNFVVDASVILWHLCKDGVEGLCERTMAWSRV